jgi:hypothetical protein
MNSWKQQNHFSVQILRDLSNFKTIFNNNNKKKKQQQQYKKNIVGFFLKETKHNPTNS